MQNSELFKAVKCVTLKWPRALELHNFYFSEPRENSTKYEYRVAHAHALFRYIEFVQTQARLSLSSTDYIISRCSSRASRTNVTSVSRKLTIIRSVPAGNNNQHSVCAFMRVYSPSPINIYLSRFPKFARARYNPAFSCTFSTRARFHQIQLSTISLNAEKKKNFLPPATCITFVFVAGAEYSASANPSTVCTHVYIHTHTRAYLH